MVLFTLGQRKPVGITYNHSIGSTTCMPFARWLSMIFVCQNLCWWCVGIDFSLFFLGLPRFANIQESYGSYVADIYLPTWGRNGHIREECILGKYSLSLRIQVHLTYLTDRILLWDGIGTRKNPILFMVIGFLRVSKMLRVWNNYLHLANPLY